MVDSVKTRDTETPNSGMRELVHKSEFWIGFTIPGSQAKRPFKKKMDAQRIPLIAQ
jgi:hypothetical protein